MFQIFAKDVNYGVKYEYLLPNATVSKNTQNSTRLIDEATKLSPNENSIHKNIPASKFSWKVTGFSACSKSCGGGLQVPNIKCIRENSSKYFPQRRCSHLKKPLLNDNLLRCNTQSCPAYWRNEEWGKCNCVSSAAGTSEREVRCVQELSSGIVIQVNKSNCFDEQPESSRPCECRSNASNVKRRMKSQKQLRNNVTEGVWIYSNWNEHCSSTCGVGFEYRSIFCDRSAVTNATCDTSKSPEVSRTCNFEKSCNRADWFTGPWSECTGSCFNLTKNRQIMCIQNNLITDNEDCNLSKKPRSSTNCSLNDVEYCKPRWHYSDWSEVSENEF